MFLLAGYICCGRLTHHREDCLHLGPGGVHLELQAGSVYQCQVCGVPDPSRCQRVLQLHHTLPPALMEHVHRSRYQLSFHSNLNAKTSVIESSGQWNKQMLILTGPTWDHAWVVDFHHPERARGKPTGNTTLVTCTHTPFTWSTPTHTCWYTRNTFFINMPNRTLIKAIPTPATYLLNTC